MEGTAYFPVNNGKSKLTQCLESGLPVFSRDVGSDGTKSFFACGYEHFVNVLYRKPYMRHTYEVIQSSLPTKVFFDLDCYTGDLEIQVEELIKVVKKDMAERWGEEVQCHVLDASTPKKQSKHIIFDIFLPNMQVVKEYVLHILALGDFEAADKSVYTNNRSFRLAYSTKMGQNNPLLPQGPPGDYDPEVVMKTMVQVKPPDHYMGRWKNLPKTQVSFRSGANLKRTYISGGFGVNVQDSIENIDLVKKYIESLGGSIRSARVENEFVYFIVGAIKCPWKGECHKHNNTYFTINKKTWQGWFKCADGDCPQVIYKKTNLIWSI